MLNKAPTLHITTLWWLTGFFLNWHKHVTNKACPKMGKQQQFPTFKQIYTPTSKTHLPVKHTHYLGTHSHRQSELAQADVDIPLFSNWPERSTSCYDSWAWSGGLEPWPCQQRWTCTGETCGPSEPAELSWGSWSAPVPWPSPSADWRSVPSDPEAHRGTKHVGAGMVTGQEK